MKQLPFFAIIFLALSLFTGEVQAQHLSVQEVPLTANHVLYDSFNGKVYASIPGSAALNPNTVVQINAASGAVEAYILVGSEPDVLALSSDGRYLYVGIDGASSVARIVLASNTVDQQFSLGTAPLAPQYNYHAGNIIPLAGMPQSVAVTRDYFDVSPPTDGVAVFDNGVRRPTILNRGISTYGALAGSNSPGRIYAYDNESTDFGFDQLNLNANGITDGQRSDSFSAGILSGFGVKIRFDKGNGLVYATNGTVVDPEALTDVGVYSLSSLLNSFPSSVVDVVPSDTENRVYFLAGPTNSFYSGPATLAVYNQTAFQQVSSFSTSTTYLSTSDLSEISPAKFVFRSDQGLEFASPQTVTSIAVTAASASVTVGGTDQFTATATYPDGSTSDITGLVTWSSDNTAVATIASGGLAQSVAPGTANITAALNGVTSLPTSLKISAPDYPTHLLWKNTSGMATVWTVGSDGSVVSTVALANSGMNPNSIADGTNGSVQLLWKSPAGAASVWTIAPDGTYTATPTYGPYGDYQAQALAVGSDNLTRLFWKNSTGASTVWTINADGTVASTPVYGPYPSDSAGGMWQAQGMAVGADNKTRLFWKDTQGEASVWTFVPGGTYVATAAFGPYGDWQAQALAVGPDDLTRLLWKNTAGSCTVWTIGLDGIPTSTDPYGPYASVASSTDWQAQAFAVGADGLTRLFWKDAAGSCTVWSVGADGTPSSTVPYGPYGDWQAIALAAGN